MKRSRIVPFALLAYVLAAGLGIEAMNAAGGGLLQQHYAEYYGEDGRPAGSLEWRTEEGKRFQTVALLFGLWVYPASVIGAAVFARRAFVEESGADRAWSAVGAALCVFVLYRFWSLGVFTAVTAF